MLMVYDSRMIGTTSLYRTIEREIDTQRDVTGWIDPAVERNDEARPQ